LVWCVAFLCSIEPWQNTVLLALFPSATSWSWPSPGALITFIWKSRVLMSYRSSVRTVPPCFPYLHALETAFRCMYLKSCGSSMRYGMSGLVEMTGKRSRSALFWPLVAFDPELVNKPSTSSRSDRGWYTSWITSRAIASARTVSRTSCNATSRSSMRRRDRGDPTVESSEASGPLAASDRELRLISPLAEAMTRSKSSMAFRRLSHSSMPANNPFFTS
jgi:hypothetical protein